MTIQTQAEAFLSQKRIAVVGVSRKQGTGNAIFKALRKRGYEVVPVNPKATEVDGETCYPDLKSIPEGVDAVVVVTRPEITEKVMHECVDVIPGGCPLMFGEGADVVHRCMRWFLGRTHKLP